MDIGDKKQKSKKKVKTMKGVVDNDDDDGSSKKPEVQLSSLSVTADYHTQNPRKAIKHNASRKKQPEASLLSATSSRQKSTSQKSTLRCYHSITVCNITLNQMTLIIVVGILGS